MMKAYTVQIAGGAIAAFFAVIPLTTSAEEMMCTMQYQPVCGARTVQCIKAPCHPVYETFGNRCVLDNADAVYIHDGECTDAETGPYIPAPTKPTNTVPKAKTTNAVKIAIDGVPLTSVNVDLSNTDTDLAADAVVKQVEQQNDNKIVSLWRGLWTRVSTWLGL